MKAILVSLALLSCALPANCQSTPILFQHVRVFDGVDGPPFAGWDGVHELATASGGIQHPLRAPECLVEHRRERRPDILAPLLVDAAQTVLIETLVVHDP